MQRVYIANCTKCNMKSWNEILYSKRLSKDASDVKHTNFSFQHQYKKSTSCYFIKTYLWTNFPRQLTESHSGLRKSQIIPKLPRSYRPFSTNLWSVDGILPWLDNTLMWWKKCQIFSIKKWISNFFFQKLELQQL